MSILIIDPMFEASADIETKAAGAGVTLDFVRTEQVPGEALRAADAIVTCRSRRPITTSIIELMERAKVLLQAGIGYNHVDIEACARRGVAVCNTPHYGTGRSPIAPSP